MGKTLESPLDSKEIKPVNPKEISPEYSLEGLMLKLKPQHFGHLMRRANSLEKTLMLGKIEGRRRRRQQRMRWLDGIINLRHRSLSKFWEIVSEGQGSLACCSPWGHKEYNTSEQLNNKRIKAENNIMVASTTSRTKVPGFKAWCYHV